MSLFSISPYFFYLFMQRIIHLKWKSFLSVSTMSYTCKAGKNGRVHSYSCGVQIGRGNEKGKPCIWAGAAKTTHKHQKSTTRQMNGPTDGLMEKAVTYEWFTQKSIHIRRGMWKSKHLRFCGHHSQVVNHLFQRISHSLLIWCSFSWLSFKIDQNGKHVLGNQN